MPVIRLLAIEETAVVSGPAKNLIEFCRRCRSLEGSGALPRIEASIAVLLHRRERGRSRGTEDPMQEVGPPSAGTAAGIPFLVAVRQAGIELDVLRERFRFDPSLIGGLRQTVERRDPDIVQTHHVKSHLLTRLSGLWRDRPWIAFHHGYTTTDLKMRCYNQLDPWSLRAAHRVITMNSAFARDLEVKGVPAERIRIVHNAVDRPQPIGEHRVRALRSALGMADDERIVLAVGRLSREKGHADLVGALAHLRRMHPGMSVRLVIVGEGPERQHVERLARSLAVHTSITFAGHVGEIDPYYAVADVLALPSHSEGSPNVLLEAMAAGLPVVATDVGGIPEIVSDQVTALITRPHDPRAIGEALGLMLTSPRMARKIAANARNAVTSRHSPETRLHKLLQIYCETWRNSSAGTT